MNKLIVLLLALCMCGVNAMQRVSHYARLLARSKTVMTSNVARGVIVRANQGPRRAMSTLQEKMKHLDEMQKTLNALVDVRTNRVAACQIKSWNKLIQEARKALADLEDWDPQRDTDRSRDVSIEEIEVGRKKVQEAVLFFRVLDIKQAAENMLERSYACMKCDGETPGCKKTCGLAPAFAHYASYVLRVVNNNVTSERLASLGSIRDVIENPIGSTPSDPDFHACHCNYERYTKMNEIIATLAQEIK